MAKRLHFDFSLSCSGEGNENPLHCSSLENPKDAGAAIYVVVQSQKDWSDLAAAAAAVFFIAQLSHPYMITGKNIALTRCTFVDKVMSSLFNMLSRLVITFLPRSKRLFISWLLSPSAVNLEPQKIKSATVSTVSPSICHEVMGPDTMILVF